MTPTEVIARNAVTVSGSGSTTLVLAHGFGCDQRIWLNILPLLEPYYQVVRFDYTGCGRSDRQAYNPEKYGDFTGYVSDLIEVCDALELQQVHLLGHSVSGIIGMRAALQRPDLFCKILALGPSPRYIDEAGYTGGFSREDVEDMLAMMERNYFEWAGYMAPLVMDQHNPPQMAAALKDSFTRSDPDISRRFARIIFFGDSRHLLPEVPVPVVLLYCTTDVIVPVEVIYYLHQKLPDSELRLIAARGHYLHLSAPDVVAEAVYEHA